MVSTETPSRTAAALHPLPRWAVPLLGYRVAKRVGWHGLVERRVEDGDLRQVGQEGSHSLDAGQVGRVVQRRQVTERADCGENRVVHPDGRGEPLPAVHHPVTGPEQVSADVPGLRQLVKHPGHYPPVGASGHSFYGCCRRKPLNSQQALRMAEPLADPPHETYAALGVHQRELNRRAARVEDQHETACNGAAGTGGRHGRLAPFRGGRRYLLPPYPTSLRPACCPSTMMVNGRRPQFPGRLTLPR